MAAFGLTTISPCVRKGVESGRGQTPTELCKRTSSRSSLARPKGEWTTGSELIHAETSKMDLALVFKDFVAKNPSSQS